ncbi:acyl-CoA dehydrogenase family protein [Acuticoccus sp. I52.16.1]|uniref:acyl-CoA dehydrogenase family protein n=1 Tax=Acuticoccus sp. I52.16.1 TaxID=2928472 RepID=UPI001FCFE461|nr:acyl-CoA dehydrogenase family protein [Acuticoccus sp. I52.16.1]UOM33445.1 acyl-CoA dehydrogenase family protein [Acuticoccus sp. I52.16.1]
MLLTEDQELIADAARRIAQEHLAPNAAALDRGEPAAREAFLANLERLAANGFMAVDAPAEYGGTEAGTTAFALTVEAVGNACAATGVTVSVTNMVGEVIASVGSEEQKRTHLPRLADGTYKAGAFCLTEASAGSDPAALTTRAVMSGNEWVLNGSKLYITSAAYAGLFVVWAVTDPDAPKGKGISAFLVEAGTPGLVVGREEDKLGQRGSATNAVHFEDCRIPADALLGPLHGGFRIAAGELAGGRIGIAALALGIARAAVDAAIAHIKEREQFGRPIAAMQGPQWMIADTETELEAARLLILQAAALKEAGRPFGKAASMAKLYASEAAQRATYTALQLFGGAGYIRDHPVERYARDVRITTIYEGTSEIQRLIIARDTLA